MVEKREIENREWRMEAAAATSLGACLRRVVRRPRAWILSYMLTTLLALILTAPMTLAWLPLTRHPIFSQILETRSLDALSDLATLGASYGGGIWSASALLLALPLWVLARLLWTWLEGGTLAEYTAVQPLSWGAFARAGWRWFGGFLALNLIGAVLVGVIGGTALLLAIAAYMLTPTLGWTIGVAGLAVAGLVATWIEVARAVALSHNEHRVFHALSDAARALFRQAVPFASLAVGGLALYGLLYLAHRWLVEILPLRWWLATLLIQQAYTLLRLGIRLTRQAGQVGLLKQ